MAKSKAKAPVELLQVRKGGRSLFWPPAAGGLLRGHAGTVVPRDDPLIDHSGLHQGHVLEAAPAGAVVTPCACPAAQALYRELKYTSVPFKEKAKEKPPEPPAAPSVASEAKVGRAEAAEAPKAQDKSATGDQASSG